MNKQIESILKKALRNHNQKQNIESEALQAFAELVINDCLDSICEEMDKFDMSMSNLPAWYKVLEAVERKYVLE